MDLRAGATKLSALSISPQKIRSHGPNQYLAKIDKHGLRDNTPDIMLCNKEPKYR
jgi:hypothetical protein